MNTQILKGGYRTLVGLTLFFVLMPLLAVVWVSFFSNQIISLPPKGYSLTWYVNAWQQSDFRDGFLLSLKLALLSTLIGMLIAVPAALALVRGRFRGRAWINTLLLSPMLIPGVVAGSALYIYYIQFEIMSGWTIAGTFPGLVGAHVVMAIPWVVRLVAASLVGINDSVEEAAFNLGARPRAVLLRVTLPMIRPGLVAAALFSFIVSFTDLEKSIFLVGPGMTTLPIAIINYLEWNMDPTICAVATVQILIIGAALVVSDRYVKLSRVF